LHLECISNPQIICALASAAFSSHLHRALRGFGGTTGRWSLGFSDGDDE
jgi:hypothetical protein